MILTRIKGGNKNVKYDYKQKKNCIEHCKRRCLLVDAFEGLVHRKIERERKRFQMFFGIMDNGKYTENKKLAQNRIIWRAAISRHSHGRTMWMEKCIIVAITEDNLSLFIGNNYIKCETWKQFFCVRRII